MTVPEIVQRDVDELAKATGLEIDLIPDGTQICVVLKKVALPPGAFNPEASDIMLIVEPQYRYSAIDMFYVEVPVLLADGAVPAGGDSIETHGARQWRRFSWHRNGVWNPARNGILDHYEFVQARLSMEVKV